MTTAPPPPPPPPQFSCGVSGIESLLQAAAVKVEDDDDVDEDDDDKIPIGHNLDPERLKAFNVSESESALVELHVHLYTCALAQSLRWI